MAASNIFSGLRLPALCMFACLLLGACKVTKHVPPDAYLLRSNSLKLNSDRTLTNKGELADALSSLIIQRPNTYFLSLFPYKVWIYNWRYKRYAKDTAAEAFQRNLRTVERPVIYDSSLSERTALHMKSYLFNQGYFYSRVSDTVMVNGRKIKAVYDVHTGLRYLINQTILDIDDSTVNAIVAASMGQSPLANGKPFAMTLAQDERSRIANLLRNRGYYKFTQENIHIEADTLNKSFLRDAENPFESAINFLALQRVERKPTVDVRIIIRGGNDSNAYRRYKIGKLRVYPDFVDRKDITDSTMYEIEDGDVTFRYHNYFVREKVLLNQISMIPGDYYTQDNYDLTITKLNELGLFQYVQTYIIEDSTLPADRPLRCIILMSPTKRYDFSVNYEVSNGTNYFIGNNVGLNFRNRNLLRGANQLSITVSGGIELNYSKSLGENFFDRFSQLSRYAGVNASLSFPKFISPIQLKRFRGANQPRTIFTLGSNVLDRVDSSNARLFTLINNATAINYNWRQTDRKSWDFSPAFINILRLPYVSTNFRQRLDSNAYLKNSYSENFIEGENLYFTYTDRNSEHARRYYSYLKVGIEESGALLSLINSAISLERSLGLKYSQYVRLEADLRHYIRSQHSELAGRFFAGVGLPYDKSSTLPYIKQYFVGGPYSIRGWRVRQLGPGSYYTPEQQRSTQSIDRTADLKLEANLEYRFDIVQLFGGALNLNGAAFVDAGNIWLARPSENYPNGEFTFSRLGRDLAVATGLGARFDISGLFVLRADGGFPIKNPDYPVNGGWVGNQINFFDRDWRSRNLVMHIAIGYPF
jgi:outer membrane protein insertion porin family